MKISVKFKGLEDFCAVRRRFGVNFEKYMTKKKKKTKNMKFVSTRGGPEVTFRTAVLEGLSANGGLFVPVSIPKLSPQTISQWAALPFPRLSENILSLFTGSDVSKEDLAGLVDRAYGKQWREPDVVKLVKAGNIDVKKKKKKYF
jgi:threonine synthase